MSGFGRRPDFRTPPVADNANVHQPAGMRTNSHYDVEGRLADVIAAVTVFAAHQDSEGSVGSWVYRLSRPADDAAKDESENHWLNVFNQHPEFFLVYKWEDKDRAALRLRYASKTIDRATGQVHARLVELNTKERSELTSLPLDAQATSTLINTAISLHQAALARKADARFFLQLFGPAVLALLGALFGALAPTILKGHPDPVPIRVSVEGLKLDRVQPAEASAQNQEKRH
jgi:hypothetical protein